MAAILRAGLLAMICLNLFACGKDDKDKDKKDPKSSPALQRKIQDLPAQELLTAKTGDILKPENFKTITLRLGQATPYTTTARLNFNSGDATHFKFLKFAQKFTRPTTCIGTKAPTFTLQLFSDNQFSDFGAKEILTLKPHTDYVIKLSYSGSSCSGAETQVQLAGWLGVSSSRDQEDQPQIAFVCTNPANNENWTTFQEEWPLKIFKGRDAGFSSSKTLCGQPITYQGTPCDYVAGENIDTYSCKGMNADKQEVNMSLKIDSLYSSMRLLCDQDQKNILDVNIGNCAKKVLSTNSVSQ